VLELSEKTIILFINIKVKINQIERKTIAFPDLKNADRFRLTGKGRRAV